MFSERLREALNRRGMAQSELCLATGIGKSAISQYLSGRNEAGYTKILVMAKALRVNPLWLMGCNVPMDTHEPPAHSQRLATDLVTRRLLIASIVMLTISSILALSNLIR